MNLINKLYLFFLYNMLVNPTVLDIAATYKLFYFIIHFLMLGEVLSFHWKRCCITWQTKMVVSLE